MLTRLVLHNFVVPQRVEITFGGGFCVLTGETGAGKSLLVGALALLAGARADSGKVHAAADSAEIEAVFDIAGNEEVQEYLREYALGDEEEFLVVRRIIGGRKAAVYINGRLAPLAQLAQMMTLLMDICGQHAHYSLKNNSTHRQLLDSYANADSTAVARSHAAWRSADEAHTQAAHAATETERTRAMLTEELKELALPDFSKDKWRQMNDVLTRTANMSDLAAGCAQIVQLLQGEDTSGIQGQLAQVRRRLDELAQHDKTLAQHVPVIDDADGLINDVLRAVSAYAEGLEVEPQAQEQAELFISDCHRLARKYAVADVERLDEFIAAKQAALDALPSAADVEQLAQAAAAARKTLDTHCGKLSRQRRQAAKTLCDEVNALLAQLAMPKAKLSVLLTPQQPPTANGSEKVMLQIATRSDMEAGSIGQIASGGELSRLGLAIQLTTSAIRGSTVSVFDEVDAGIGGGAAGVVGALLRRLGASRQVLCVTHLPQVAAQAHAHWHVRGGASLSVLQLDKAQRVEEIARMQSGEVITDTARRYAEELLQV